MNLGVNERKADAGDPAVSATRNNHYALTLFFVLLPFARAPGNLSSSLTFNENLLGYEIPQNIYHAFNRLPHTSGGTRQYDGRNLE